MSLPWPVTENLRYLYLALSRGSFQVAIKRGVATLINKSCKLSL